MAERSRSHPDDDAGAEIHEVDFRVRPDIELDDPSLYINRELSLLEFQRRVLAQARGKDRPLLERLRFLTISSSILDEFFEVRVGGLKEQISVGISAAGPDGLAPQETLSEIREMAEKLVREQYRILNYELRPELESEGIVIYQRDRLTTAQRKWARAYFQREVLPVLTPMGLDPAHPFPRVLNKSLNYIVALDGKGAFGRRVTAAVVQAPRVLPRLIPLPEELCDVRHGFVLLTTIMHENIGDIFPRVKVKGCYEFRVTRNSNLWIDEEEVQDILLALKGELSRRHFGSAVRLEVSDCPEDMTSFLLNQFDLSPKDLYRVDGPVNLHRLGTLYDLVDNSKLKSKPFLPARPAELVGGGTFETLQARDVLLHHPYQSFLPVVEWIREAAQDPNVLAIKMTLYRTGVDSPIGLALLEAARAGKEVTVVVELRARFDEAANIELASRLQEAGVKVVYGVVGYKAHSKMLMIVRREGTELRRYVHLGTGNYNTETTRSYTDFGLMSADPDLGHDVHTMFQQLTSLGRTTTLKRIIQTPFDLHDRILELIEAEIANAEAGRTARIMVKTNSLTEREAISALYRASQAGVRIDLIVRGICSLRPGLPGISENIRVRSIVGRFLEHHRVFYFFADGEEVTLLSSADWRPRNFFRRVETTFPIRGKKNKQRVIHEGLEVYLQDNVGAWEMRSDGSYVQQTPGTEDPLNAQETLLDEARKSGPFSG